MLFYNRISNLPSSILSLSKLTLFTTYSRLDTRVRPVKEIRYLYCFSNALVTRYRIPFVSDSFLYLIRLSVTRYHAIRYTFHWLSVTKCSALKVTQERIRYTQVPCNHAVQGYPIHFLIRNLIFRMRDKKGAEIRCFTTEDIT